MSTATILTQPLICANIPIENLIGGYQVINLFWILYEPLYGKPSILLVQLILSSTPISPCHPVSCHFFRSSAAYTLACLRSFIPPPFPGLPDSIGTTAGHGSVHRGVYFRVSAASECGADISRLSSILPSFGT